MPSPSNPKPSNISPTIGDEVAFSEVVRLIGAAREKAIQAVNAALIELYREIGATISRKVEAAERGDGTVDRLALFIARTQPGLRGFSRPNLFRMKQFYEAYREEPIVSPLVRQLPRSHHLVILAAGGIPSFLLTMIVQTSIVGHNGKRSPGRSHAKAGLFPGGGHAP
jgi:hypothetical protein